MNEIQLLEITRSIMAAGVVGIETGNTPAHPACTNLGNPVWTPIGTNTLSDGWSYFSDPTWTNYPSRFYRVRSL